MRCLLFLDFVSTVVCVCVCSNVLLHRFRSKFLKEFCTSVSEHGCSNIVSYMCQSVECH